MDDNYCRAKSGGIGWTCSLDPKHAGDHIAYHHHAQSRGVLSRWPQWPHEANLCNCRLEEDGNDAVQHIWGTGNCLNRRNASPFPPNFDTNPKDLIGAKKVSMTALPDIAMLQGNRAMMDGAKKYGPYNWREKKIQADIYVDAARRHIAAWFDGEENAEDSGVHHLGHAIATLGIILDAQANDALVDNRPPKGGGFTKALARLNGELIK